MGMLRRILGNYLKNKPIRQHAREIEEAIQRVVEEVNPRIRFVPGYRDKLGNATWRALKYTDRIIEGIAGPVECSREQWQRDPLLRALFTNSRDMRERFSRSRPVREFLEGGRGRGADECYAVLAATRQVKSVLGVELRGDVVQRDVPQIMVSFSDHIIMSPASSEGELRRAMKGFAAEFLAHQALAQIASARSHHEDLEQERALLRARVRMKQRQDKGLGCLCGRVNCSDAEMGELCARMAEMDRQLESSQNDVHSLDHFIQTLKAVLEVPEQYLRLERLSLRLDSMNIAAAGKAEGESTHDIPLTEVQLAGQPARVMLVAKFPRRELLGPEETAMDLDRALSML